MNRVTLCALAVLVSGASQAGQLYAGGSLAWQGQHAACHMADGSIAQACKWDRPIVLPLLGSVEVGYTVTRGRVQADLYARHESAPAVSDLGVNTLGVAVRVRLWGTP